MACDGSQRRRSGELPGLEQVADLALYADAVFRALEQRLRREPRVRFLALLTFGIAVVLAPHCADALDFPGGPQGAPDPAAAQISYNASAHELTTAEPSEASPLTTEPIGGLTKDGLYQACVSLLLSALMALLVLRVAPFIRREPIGLHKTQVSGLLFGRQLAPSDLGICRT